MLSDAQKILVDRDYVVTSNKAPSPLDRATLTMMDAAQILHEGDKWQRLYTQVISGRK
jgi:iron(III) transport system substrate-binding protein